MASAGLFIESAAVAASGELPDQAIARQPHRCCVELETGAELCSPSLRLGALAKGRLYRSRLAILDEPHDELGAVQIVPGGKVASVAAGLPQPEPARLVDEGYFKFSTSDHYRNDVNIEVILEDDYKIQLDVQVYTAQKEEAHTVIWQRWDPPREIRSTFSAKPSSDYHVWLRAYSTLPLAPRYRLVITLVQ
jgi:hypothetical protein